MGKSKRSPYFDLEEADPNGGATGYQREQIYRYLFDNSDKYGIIVYSIADLAKAVDVDRQRLGMVYKEFIELGLMEKVTFNKFRVLVDPDEFDWGDEFQAKSKEVRKKYQYVYKNKLKQEGD